MGEEAGDVVVGEGAVEVYGSGHGVGELEGEDSDGGGGGRAGGLLGFGPHLLQPGLGDHGDRRIWDLGLGLGFWGLNFEEVGVSEWWE